jgi:hypothetical protein
MPDITTRACCGSQFLTMAVSAFQTAKVTAFARTNAGHEKSHGAWARWQIGAAGEKTNYRPSH